MYDFALEDCTILHVKNVSIGVLENIENQKIFSPHKLCLQKIAFELWLGFENLEMYTLQALREVTLICSFLWGIIWVITRQSNLECQENYSLFHN